MPIIQVPIYFPEEIAKGLIDGSLEVGGLVIRNGVGSGKGRIVKHVPIAGDKVAKVAKESMQLGVKAAQANPVAAIGLGIGVAVLGTAGALVTKEAKRKKKRRHGKSNYVPPEIRSFWKAVNEYKRAGDRGEMSEAEINNVIKALDDIDNSEHRYYLWSKLSAKNVYDVFRTMQDYTQRLAKANGVAISDIGESEGRSTCNVIDLRPILKEQKKIFEKAG